jgi:hypothetical protein
MRIEDPLGKRLPRLDGPVAESGGKEWFRPSIVGAHRLTLEASASEEIRPGDVVWFPPGEKHWHGATPSTAMTHIANQEKLDGQVVEWMEHVTDEEYNA